MHSEPVVYWMAKLSHSGITGFKRFENCQRKMHENSLLNIDQIRKEKANRELNQRQSLQIKRYCQKLAYYSATRQFKSKKSGKYRFKVAFLTLTAPDSAQPEQILKAFEGFLDYLRRTANCVFVWKKELGEQSKRLHFHIMINNFIPYYIVSWKWKRLLIAQGVEWPLTDTGKHTDSHYRIELPRNKKLVAHYIAKYLSKAFPLPKEYGYVAGHSADLKHCQEIRFIPSYQELEEIRQIREKCYTIEGDYFTHICCDLLQLKSQFPLIGAVFEQMYMEFSEKLTLEQKFDTT
jgi:hypothetical protein